MHPYKTENVVNAVCVSEFFTTLTFSLLRPSYSLRNNIEIGSVNTPKTASKWSNDRKIYTSLTENQKVEIIKSRMMKACWKI